MQERSEVLSFVFLSTPSLFKMWPGCLSGQFGSVLLLSFWLFCIYEHHWTVYISYVLYLVKVQSSFKRHLSHASVLSQVSQFMKMLPKHDDAVYFCQHTHCATDINSCRRVYLLDVDKYCHGFGNAISSWLLKQHLMAEDDNVSAAGLSGASLLPCNSLCSVQRQLNHS